MTLQHTTTEDKVWQRAARAAIRGNAKAIAWLDRRGWSVTQAKRFVIEWCPFCGEWHSPENGNAGYGCESGR